MLNIGATKPTITVSWKNTANFFARWSDGTEDAPHEAVRFNNGSLIIALKLDGRNRKNHLGQVLHPLAVAAGGPRGVRVSIIREPCCTSVVCAR